jgi:hypothetical protein
MLFGDGSNFIHAGMGRPDEAIAGVGGFGAERLLIYLHQVIE